MIPMAIPFSSYTIPGWMETTPLNFLSRVEANRNGSLRIDVYYKDSAEPAEDITYDLVRHEVSHTPTPFFEDTRGATVTIEPSDNGMQAYRVNVPPGTIRPGRSLLRVYKGGEPLQDFSIWLQ